MTRMPPKSSNMENGRHCELRCGLLRRSILVIDGSTENGRHCELRCGLLRRSILAVDGSSAGDGSCDIDSSSLFIAQGLCRMQTGRLSRWPGRADASHQEAAEQNQDDGFDGQREIL